MIIFFENLRDIEWEHNWEHNLELREVPMMVSQEVM